MITRLGRPYAQAFLDTLGSTGAATNALQQLRTVEEAMEKVPALRHMAANPGIPLETKRRALLEIADHLGCGQSVVRLLELLLENYRFVNLPEIIESFEDLLNRQLGIVRARVVSAAALDDAQRADLQRVLEGLSGARIELDTAVEPDLLGGFVAHVGSRRYDTSVKGQLERMARTLASDEAP